MFRPVLISLFLTSTALATTWTVDDDGKADFDNIQDAVDAGPLSAGNCCGDEDSSRPSFCAMAHEFGSCDFWRCY